MWYRRPFTSKSFAYLNDLYGGSSSTGRLRLGTTFFVLCVSPNFVLQSILAVEDRVLDEDLLGYKLARRTECQQNMLPQWIVDFQINGESSGPRVYSVPELVEFPKHWSRLGSFIITSWLNSRAYPMYNVFGHADTWKSPEYNVFFEWCVMLSVWNVLFWGDNGQFG